MTTPASPDVLTLSIAAVERDTGIGKDSLRVWERRYGFPVPGRDAFGERSYPLEQVEKLRLIRRLMDQGHRPGRIVAQPMAALLALSQTQSVDGDAPSQRRIPEHLQPYIDPIKGHDSEALQAQLTQALAREGLADFVTDLVAPLIVCVGDAWVRGELAVFEEHLFTECITRVMRLGIANCPKSRHDGAPKVLLTTFPQESHGLGILMVECLLVQQGCTCLSLGTQTPVRDIAQAALAHRVDVVALSFSSLMKTNDVLDGLAELRHHLPAVVTVWAGGQAAALKRRKLAQVEVLRGLDDVAVQVKRWRSAALKSKA
jgi:methanogenic corrinoid protein MtbC1